MRTGLALTSEQRSLIGLDDGAFLVIAPPGSGKTTVLTERVARLVSNPADTFRVLALTFTNKAAGNMRARLFESVGHHSARVAATTMHSFSLEALRAYGEMVGLPDNVSIYESTGDRLAALRRGLVDEGIYHDAASVNENVLRSLLASISGLKRSLIPPEQAPQTIEAGEIPLHIAYAAYDRTLRMFGALDFDDILFFACRLFIERDRVAKQYRQIFRYIVIDEAQDTNVAQYELLRALCGPNHRNVMLVADADQSIFRFAGATTVNLLRFETEFKATRLGLTQNFRCAQQIVEAANKLIAHNSSRITAGAEMKSAALAAGYVSARSYRDEASEAAAVMNAIDGLLQNGLAPEWCHGEEATDIAAEDICILGRSRYVLGEVMSALEKGSLPFQFSAGRDSLFESGLFARLEAALRLVHNPADVLAQRAMMKGASGTEVGADLKELLGRLPAWQTRALAPVLALQADSSRLDDVLGQIVALVRTAEIANELERAATLTDAATLETRWTTFRYQHGSDATVGRFLGDIAIAGRASLEGPGIRVLTIHAAKGLEFRAVMLVGMNDGSFPDYRSSTAEEIADERRNAYVAITRAERALYLFRPRLRTLPWGDVRAQNASRFVAEAGLSMQDV